MRAEDIIAAARSMVGTPFHHQGRQPGVGLDCAGVLVSLCQAFGIPHQDSCGYSRHPHAGLLEAALAAQPALVVVPIAEMRAADVLLMRFRSDPQHLALYADPTVIHSLDAVGRVVEHHLDAAWRARIVAVYRFAGVAA